MRRKKVVCHWMECEAAEIEVEYQDMNFKKKREKYSGWTAQIIQHEIDHCDGILI